MAGSLLVWDEEAGIVHDAGYSEELRRLHNMDKVCGERLGCFVRTTGNEGACLE